jgi:hypothetical protein
MTFGAPCPGDTSATDSAGFARRWVPMTPLAGHTRRRVYAQKSRSPGAGMGRLSCSTPCPWVSGSWLDHREGRYAPLDFQMRPGTTMARPLKSFLALVPGLWL